MTSIDDMAAEIMEGLSEYAELADIPTAATTNNSTGTRSASTTKSSTAASTTTD
jgi:hypothetical protein